MFRFFGLGIMTYEEMRQLLKDNGKTITDFCIFLGVGKSSFRTTNRDGLKPVISAALKYYVLNESGDLDKFLRVQHHPVTRAVLDELG